jgi:hypothetical protein
MQTNWEVNKLPNNRDYPGDYQFVNVPHLAYFSKFLYIDMLVYYTFQDKYGGSLSNPALEEIWKADFPSSFNLSEMKNKLAFWHSLVSSSLRLFESFPPGEDRELYRFGWCVKFPVLVSVGKPQILKEIPITHVLWYLLTRDKKFKPKLV